MQMFSLTSDRRTQTLAPHTHTHGLAQTLRCSKQRKLRRHISAAKRRKTQLVARTPAGMLNFVPAEPSSVGPAGAASSSAGSRRLAPSLTSSRRRAFQAQADFFAALLVFFAETINIPETAVKGWPQTLRHLSYSRFFWLLQQRAFSATRATGDGGSLEKSPGKATADSRGLSGKLTGVFLDP